MIKNGIETMIYLTEWYRANSGGAGVGFFQIGGGTAGDFPICVVPMMAQDLEWKDVPLWSYFCQISDSTTSYGSYSGAVPNEKITWGKLSKDTPRFIVESDATILGQALQGHSPLHRRVRRHHRGSADLRLRPRLVAAPTGGHSVRDEK